MAHKHWLIIVYFIPIFLIIVLYQGPTGLTAVLTLTFGWLSFLFIILIKTCFTFLEGLIYNWSTCVRDWTNKGCLCEKIGLCRSELPDATCSSLLEDLDTCNMTLIRLHCYQMSTDFYQIDHFIAAKANLWDWLTWSISVNFRLLIEVR